MFRVVFCVLATLVFSGFVFAQQPGTDRKSQLGIGGGSYILFGTSPSTKAATNA